MTFVVARLAQPDDFVQQLVSEVLVSQVVNDNGTLVAAPFADSTAASEHALTN